MMDLNTPALVAAGDEGQNIVRLPAKNSTLSKHAIIPINNQYRIKGNELCWSVEKLIKRTRGDTWEGLSWHGNIGAAATSLCQRMVRTSGALGVTEVLLAQESAISTISQALTGLYEVEFVSDE